MPSTPKAASSTPRPTAKPRAKVRHSCAGRNLRPPRHSCVGRNLRPQPSFLRRQEPAPPRHSCAGRNPRSQPSFLRPIPSFLRRQEPPAPTPTPAPFPNSSLPPSRGEARWGVGRCEQAPPVAPAPLPVAPALPTVIPAPPTVIPAPPTVIPAQAGTRAPLPSPLRPQPSFLRRQEPPAPTPTPAPFPNSSLPPSRGEVRWGVGRCEQAPPVAPAPLSRRPRALSVIPAQAGTRLRRARRPPPCQRQPNIDRG